jgi:hypothetical protein
LKLKSDINQLESWLEVILVGVSGFEDLYFLLFHFYYW